MHNGWGGNQVAMFSLRDYFITSFVTSMESNFVCAVAFLWASSSLKLPVAIPVVIVLLSCQSNSIKIADNLTKMSLSMRSRLPRRIIINNFIIPHNHVMHCCLLKGLLLTQLVASTYLSNNHIKLIFAYLPARVAAVKFISHTIKIIEI